MGQWGATQEQKENAQSHSAVPEQEAWHVTQQARVNAGVCG